jgi:adenylate kinase family enzyme
MMMFVSIAALIAASFHGIAKVARFVVLRSMCLLAQSCFGGVMKRVVIIGGPGSGKSTLARKMGAITGLPVVHIDHIHWQPGWVERSSAEKDRLTREVHARQEWIFEGGHFRTLDERLQRADTFIWLDFPVGVRLWGVLARTWRDYGRTRPDLPENCPERFNVETLKFIHFIWTTRNRWRERLENVIMRPRAGLTCYRFKSIADIDAYTDALSHRLGRTT